MALYGLQNNSTLEILTIFEWEGLPEELSSPLDGYSVYSGSLDNFTGSFYEFPIPQYTGGFSGSFTGSFYGSIAGDVDYINFNTDPNLVVTPQVGTLSWDDGYGTLDVGLKGGNVTLNIGQQTYAMVYNDEATTLNKGEVVYISGAQGNRIAVKRASSIGDATSTNTLGLVAETILSGEEGLVIANGVLTHMNTLGLTAGALVYLSNTPGAYTTTKPIAPIHTVVVGFVERVHGTVGSIYVKVDNAYELEELHNVRSEAPKYGDILMYGASVWTGSKELSGSYALTGSLFVTGSITGSFTGSLTGSLDGTASYAIIQKDYKAGSVSAMSWGLVGPDFRYDVVFDSIYQNTNYAVTISATSDARIWTIQNKLNTGFTINSNSNTPLTGDVFWISLPYNS